MDFDLSAQSEAWRIRNDAYPVASWFETPRLRPPGYGGLLTMRV